MSDQGSRAKAIFLEALEQGSPEAVAAFLDSTCAGDQSLRLRVEELLKAHRDAGNFLGGSSFPGSRTEEADVESPGASLGPYKLLEQIGEGGFGVVFMAEQQHPVRRTVALKVIKPGMDSRQVIARFEAERQALAIMDHPNIAKVFDAGVVSGRPYFVMELVKGIPITEYCDRHQLTPRDRLALFISVCQAVQHAHQKGIVHRDLKPTNVLVAAYDGLAAPKVIDFGVAKALGQPLTEKTLITGFAGIIGTLEYMSPEQAEFNARDIDTRADIYSLGVLLYELLTGTTPIPKEKLKQAAMNESLRLIREEEPPKPSSRLSQSKERLASVSAQRKLEPARLTKEVQGELDWIVMKALEKDRGRHYETANAFFRDIQRYLNEEPVEACPPSTTYRLRKFARRNRKVLSTIAAFFLLMMIGTFVSSWLAIRTMQAEQTTARERDRAVSEKACADEQAAIAKAVNEFLQNDLLAQASADAQAGPGRRPDPDTQSADAPGPGERCYHASV